MLLLFIGLLLTIRPIINLHYSLYLSFLTFSYINILGFLSFIVFLSQLSSGILSSIYYNDFFTIASDSIISIIYLGIVATGLAWLLRFRILKNNGLVFQAQVAYLIPIFGIILSYIFLKEIITPKVLVSVAAIIAGIYFVKKSNVN